MSLTAVAAPEMMRFRYFRHHGCYSFVFDFQTRDDGDAHDAEMTAARWIAMFHVASHITVACAAWC
jgi:hypothetical protein